MQSWPTDWAEIQHIRREADSTKSYIARIVGRTGMMPQPWTVCAV